MNSEPRKAPTLSIAVVDDDILVAKLTGKYLADLQHKVRVFENGETCLADLRKEAADIVITDLNMPGITGWDLLQVVKKEFPDTEVIISTGHTDKTLAFQAMQLGAFDFFVKPVEKEELLASVRRTSRYLSTLQERNRYRSQLSLISEQALQSWQTHSLIGESAAMQKIFSDIRVLQNSDNVSVLILGESGTGKELVAKTIHSESARMHSPFIAVNCSAIPEHLAESILFGHEKGSFTGATASRKGSFELADQGTLFLDEIGDMQPVIQAKLLRVLEDDIVEPVGSSKGKKVDLRIIAATNADLGHKVQRKEFRQDLFHRLSAFVIHMPPLRERREDIPILAEHFVQSISAEMAMPRPPISKASFALLQEYDYPGNIRELKNILEQALIRASGKEIQPEHLLFLGVPIAPLTPAAPTPQRMLNEMPDLPLNLKELEKMAIRKALLVAGGNVSSAARMLGIGRAKLYRIFRTSGFAKNTIPSAWQLQS